MILGIQLERENPSIISAMVVLSGADADDNGGDLIVTETVVFQFEGEPFTFAFRELLSDQTGGIEELNVFLDGRPMTCRSI